MLNSTILTSISSSDSLLEYLSIVKEHSTELGIGLLTALGARFVYKTVKRANTFSDLDGPAPTSFLWGDEALLYDFETSLKIHDELLEQYGAVCRIKGPLGEDRIWIADPRAMGDMVVKGFDDFHEVEGFVAWFALTHGPTIITTTDSQPSLYRGPYAKLGTTPTFNSITRYLEDIITSKVRASGGNTAIIDIHNWMSNVALEMIGQAGMGYSFGVMEGKEPEYLEASRQLLLKNVTDTMDETAAEVYQQKKRALANGTLESEIAAGNDVMSMMLKQNEVVPAEDQMTEAEIQAQVNGLLFGGHDTTSAALARTLHLLAQYPEAQDRLRAEVRKAHGMHGKDLDYDQLNSLKYLDAVCRESLRLWSPAQLTERIAVKDWDLPLRYPVKSKDGRTVISNLHIKKGTHLYLSLGSVNRDKQTWGDDADQFKPSRWLGPLPNSVTESKIPGVYSNTMTFLGGPRSCIGFKFSQLEMKVVLSSLVSSFRFDLGPEEPVWVAAGVAKPHARHDGMIHSEPSLHMKVTIVDD
ncbi:unnamed protein product [Rhizoctonia solani]|uniref:Cytochrome P450 family protein n=1 Tax=Rhizoctonia solani TaxID=456999 RepID=A0A8H3BGZ6_9AGAM|nr:unnamed protein product [Rhizoctonia solani]